MLANSGARWAFVDARWQAVDRAAADEARRRSSASSRSAAPSTRALLERDPAAAIRRRAPRRSCMALLHERHDRTAEGRRDHARQPACDEPALPRRRRAVAPGDAILHRGAAVARLGALRAAARPRAARSTSCRSRAASTPTRSVALLAALGPRVVLRRADDGEAARRRRRRSAIARARPAEEHRLRRRPDVRRRLQGGVRGARAAPRADLRPGRIADDDHRDESRVARRRDRARRRRAHRLGRRRADRHRRRRRGRRRRAAAGGRGRRSAGARADGDARATGGIRRRARRRSPTAGCTPATSARFDGDGFLTLKDRSKDLIISGGSNIYPREVEEVLLRAPGRRRSGGRSAARTRVGRGSRRLRRRARRVAGRRRAAALERSLDALCLERIARFKRPKAYVFLARAAEEQRRQGAEDRAARAVASR